MEPQLPPSNNFEKTVLIGIYRNRREKSEQESSLEELQRLAETAGASVTQSLFFELREIHPATWIGKGKVEEIARFVNDHRIALVVSDEDLTPTQNRNLEESLETKVIDRTGLILDIFAKRARSREGKIQVELAQLKYRLPRLTGKGIELSRLAGGIGTRGPGETQLEVDQRRVREKIGILTSELKRLRAHRALHREKRQGVPIAMVSLVGYTNAGKSTLMNRLTDAGLPVEDKLFVTLDPTVRRVKLPSGREILLADTVGFLRKLPHQLIEAFQTTFEEAVNSDLLLHIVDLSKPGVLRRIEVVDEVLKELGLQNHPHLRILNKVDQIMRGVDSHFVPAPRDLPISALTGKGLSELLQAIDQKLSESFRHLKLVIPHQEGSALSLLYATSRILHREDRREGVRLEVEVSEKYFNKFKKFRIPSP